MNTGFCNFNDARGICDKIAVMPKRQASPSSLPTSSAPTVKGPIGPIRPPGLMQNAKHLVRLTIIIAGLHGFVTVVNAEREGLVTGAGAALFSLITSL